MAFAGDSSEMKAEENKIDVTHEAIHKDNIENIDEISKEEYEAKRNKYGDGCPVWPQVPTPCPVNSCHGEGNFKTFNEFLCHWNATHSLVSYHYVCQITGEKIYNKNKAQCHRKTHKENKKLTQIFTRNASYVNPEDALPYRSGSAAERKMIIEHRLDSLKTKNIDATCEKTPSDNCAYEVLDSSATKGNEKSDNFSVDQSKNTKNEKVDATCEKILSENSPNEVLDSSARKVDEKLDSFSIDQSKDKNEKTVVSQASEASISQALETASIVVNEKLDSFSIDQSKDKNEKTIVSEASEASISQALETDSIIVNEKLDSFSIDHSKDKNEMTIVSKASEVSVSQTLETASSVAFEDLLENHNNQDIDGQSNVMADISCKEIVNHDTSEITRFGNDIAHIERYVSLVLLYIVLFLHMFR